jgi:hypothetical protein
MSHEGAHLFHRKTPIVRATHSRNETRDSESVPPRVEFFVGRSHMKKLIVLSFALALMMALLALAQETGKSGEMKQDTMKAEKASGKAVSLSGKISDDGKTFVDKENKSWTVSNPEALKGHEGHEVTLKGHVNADKSEIHVLSVKMGKAEMKESKKKDEMKY